MSGPTYTLVSGVMATTRVDITVAAVAPPPIPAPDTPVYYQNTSSVDVAPWLVVNGQPKALPALGIGMRTNFSIGDHEMVEGRRPPVTLNIDADLRYLATAVDVDESGNVAGYDGVAGQWHPSSRIAGYDLVAPAGMTPEGLDLLYSYNVGGLETTMPAVVLTGGQCLELNRSDEQTDAFTFVAVAVLHPNDKDYSQLLDVAPARAAAVALRYYPRLIQAWTDSAAAEHDLLESLGRPIMVALAVDASGGRLHVVERRRSSDVFDVSKSLPVDLHFRIAADLAGGRFASVDLVEIDLWTGRALDAGEVEYVFSELDDAYGVTG